MSDQTADQERVKHDRPRERRVVRMPDGRVMRTNQKSSPRPRKAE